MGVDGVPKVWKYGGVEMEDWVWKVCGRIWKGEDLPEEWRDRVIVPIRKKGKADEVVGYRGVTIMPTLDKIYTAALTERLRGEVERKELIPPNQTGFRKGLGTVDNIYVLNYIVNRQIEKVES